MRVRSDFELFATRHTGMHIHSHSLKCKEYGRLCYNIDECIELLNSQCHSSDGGILMQYNIMFNASNLPKDTKRYVCWLDIMGIQNSMAWSVASTSNFIFKLHAVTAKYRTRNVKLYPVMDGIYVVSKKQEPFEEFIVKLMFHLTQLFKEEQRPYYRFVVRGSISYGTVVEGKDVKSKKVLPYFESNSSYKNSIILGKPILDAYIGEKKAPPLGIHINDSALSLFPKETIGPNSWLWWWKSKYLNLDRDGMNEFHKAMKSYFDYFRKGNTNRTYEINSLQRHEKLYLEYLGLKKW
jgi:hypothetical protein